MSKSFNPQIFKLEGAPEPTPHETLEWWLNDGCRVSKCRGKQDYLCSYDYITGRRGHISTRDQFCCESHARRFCKNHKLDISLAPSIQWAERHNHSLKRLVMSDESRAASDELQSVETA